MEFLYIIHYKLNMLLVGTVDSIVKPIDEMAAGRSLGSQIYQNLILYPKAGSQMAKTILSPFTHARNFISAGAFAMANGIIPFSIPKLSNKLLMLYKVASPGARKETHFIKNFKTWSIKLTGATWRSTKFIKRC